MFVCLFQVLVHANTSYQIILSFTSPTKQVVASRLIPKFGTIPKVDTISHGHVDCRLRESFDCFLETLKFLLELFFVSFALLRVRNDWQSFKLLVCLFSGLFEVLQGVLSLRLRHKSRARWVSRHFLLKSFLLNLVLALVFVLVDVAGNLSIVLVWACNICIFLVLWCRGLHLENGLVHIVLDIILLLVRSL